MFEENTIGLHSHRIKEMTVNRHHTTPAMKKRTNIKMFCVFLLLQFVLIKHTYYLFFKADI